jgi:hypothetical protein
MATITAPVKVEDFDRRVTIDTDLAEIIFIRRSDRSFRSQTAKPRVYVWGNSQESILDDLVNRHHRPSTLFRAGLKAAFADAGIDFNFAEMYWDQRAGCSCPCSPGFIAQRQVARLEVIEDGEANVIRMLNFEYFDVFVTLKTVPSV